MRAALSVICSMTLLLVGGCAAPETDVAHHAVTLTPPYSDLPPAPAGAKIESGVKVVLDARLQEAVVTGVAKWMKDPRTVQFGTMEAARRQSRHDHGVWRRPGPQQQGRLCRHDALCRRDDGHHRQPGVRRGRHCRLAARARRGGRRFAAKVGPRKAVSATVISRHAPDAPRSWTCWTSPWGRESGAEAEPYCLPFTFHTTRACWCISRTKASVSRIVVRDVTSAGSA